MTTTFKKIGVKVLRVAALVYVGMCLVVFFRQSRYVYYPERNVEKTPQSLKMEFEDLRIHTADGETLAGWFIPAEFAKRVDMTLLFCHGNAGNNGDRVGSIRTFHDLGLDVMIFDYRGYGQSTGTPGEKGTYADAAAAWDYLTNTRGIPPASTIVFGRSLGGAIATHLAAQIKPAALVLESTFTSAPDMGARMFPFFIPIRLLARFHYDTVKVIRDVTCPVLVAHSPDDEMIPFKFGERIFEAAAEPKQFVRITGDHNGGGMEIDANYKAQFVKFVQQAKRGAAAPQPKQENPKPMKPETINTNS